MTILLPILFPLTAMNRVNKENVALLVVLFMLLVCPQLSACSEIRPIYTIQDSGKRGVGVSGWLDNDRVVFYSEQQAQAKVGDDPVGPSIVDAGYYVWNTESGTLSKDPRFEGAAKLCVQGNVVTFLRKSPGEEPPSKLHWHASGAGSTMTGFVGLVVSSFVPEPCIDCHE